MWSIWFLNIFQSGYICSPYLIWMQLWRYAKLETVKIIASHWVCEWQILTEICLQQRLFHESLTNIHAKHIDHYIDMYWFTYTSRYRLQGWDHKSIRGKSRFHNRFYHSRVHFMVTNPEMAFHAHFDRISIFTNEIPRFHISKALVDPTYLSEPRHWYMDIPVIAHNPLIHFLCIMHAVSV